MTVCLREDKKIISTVKMILKKFILFCCFLIGLCRAEAGLYLAINALAFEDPEYENGEVVKRRIEINWYGAQVSVDDKILVNCEFCEETIFSPADYPDGFHILPGNLPYPSLDQMGFMGTCVFGYNASWQDGDGNIRATNCLRSEPTWMMDHRDALGDMTVGELVLAGSHDAGAYHDYQGVGDDNWGTSAVFAQVRLKWLIIINVWVQRRRIFLASSSGESGFLT